VLHVRCFAVMCLASHASRRMHHMPCSAHQHTPPHPVVGRRRCHWHAIRGMLSEAFLNFCQPCARLAALCHTHCCPMPHAHTDQDTDGRASSPSVSCASRHRQTRIKTRRFTSLHTPKCAALSIKAQPGRQLSTPLTPPIDPSHIQSTSHPPVLSFPPSFPSPRPCIRLIVLIRVKWLA